MISLRLVLAAGFFSAVTFASPLSAALPVFALSTPVTADANVLNLGTAVLGFNFAAAIRTVNGVSFSGNTTQNGVTFSFANLGGSATNGINAAGVTPNLSTSLASILSNNRYDNRTTVASSFTLSGLTSGHQYELQIFDGTTAVSGSYTLTDGTTSASLFYGPATSGSGADFITETFTAGPSQAETISMTINSGYVILNALDLRDITAAPEPGTWAMMLGGAGLLYGAMWALKTRRSA